MTNYIIRRLLMVPLLLFGVTIIIFGMLQLLGPVERSALYIKDFPKNDKQVQAVIKQYGLDQPLYVQYWRWLTGVIDPITGERQGGILYGDFGYSRTASQPVIDIVKERFPNTVDLALWTIYPMLSIGIWMGVQAAVNQNKFFDQAARVYSIIGTSFPTFVFGLLLLMLLYARAGWFMPGKQSNWVTALIYSGELKQYTHLLTIDAILNLRFDVLWDALRHMIMPIITLSYINWAVFVRVTRSSMLETLRQDYVVTARAKGLKESDVINHHARPNAMLPVVTLAGSSIVGLLGGVVITETVFNYPGIGKAAADAAAQLDVVTILGLAIFTGTILILSNLIVDVIYAFIDPRVRLT
ncbi:MAG TPA: ABC transporter permease [Anaerolineaceae bacterium]|jgi:peptide/nickel transport system permease protein|nr:ABC transporter permease [Anaerolineaceae bacterium]HUM49812.1 ABC transporter permease [Anaerolineaceae bacterium]